MEQEQGGEDIDPGIEQPTRYQGVLPECKEIRQSYKVPVETIIQARQTDDASDANRHDKKYDEQQQCRQEKQQQWRGNSKTFCRRGHVHASAPTLPCPCGRGPFKNAVCLPAP